MHPMSAPLTPEQIAAYRAQGCVFPIRVMPASEAAALAARIQTVEVHGEPGSARVNRAPYRAFPFTEAMVRHPRVLDAVACIVGPDIACFGAQFFFKGPRDPGFVSWHQDGAYWGDIAGDLVSAWIALTPSGPENGCLRVVAGSHQAPLRHAQAPSAHNLLSRGQCAELAVDAASIREICLAPGEMSLHHSLAVHGSEPNRSDAPRIGFAIRYGAAHLQPAPGEGASVLVRGARQDALT
jgi:non-heme Fe2+,alpha-ketoglutarate-dependent halogenase